MRPERSVVLSSANVYFSAQCNGRPKKEKKDFRNYYWIVKILHQSFINEIIKPTTPGMCLILLALGETEKLLKLEKRHPKIQIFFFFFWWPYLTQVKFLIKKHKKSRIILIINHHHKRHPLRRLKITFSKTPPPTLFLISHQVRSTQILPRGLQRKVSNFYYWFLKIYFYGNWKAEIYWVQKTCGLIVVREKYYTNNLDICRSITCHYNFWRFHKI